MLNDLKDTVMGLVERHIHLAEPIVFALGFAESMIFLSLLVPSSFLFLAIGGLHSAAGGSFWSVWLAASAGAFLGDVVTFVIGRFLRGEIGSVWPLRDHPDWYVAARGFVTRYGALSIVAGKFAGVIRPFVPLVASAMQMRWHVFLPASLVSCLLWAGAFLGPGYGMTLLWDAR
ncbi:MAG: DedA family protein [Hyphomicrobiaceae bacterium]|nr:DedA family protein [Hyphomicrobiaceae bacterium]